MQQQIPSDIFAPVRTPPRRRNRPQSPAATPPPPPPADVTVVMAMKAGEASVEFMFSADVTCDGGGSEAVVVQMVDGPYDALSSTQVASNVVRFEFSGSALAVGDAWEILSLPACLDFHGGGVGGEVRMQNAECRTKREKKVHHEGTEARRGCSFGRVPRRIVRAVRVEEGEDRFVVFVPSWFILFVLHSALCTLRSPSSPLAGPPRGAVQRSAWRRRRKSSTSA